jgi:hypothetical protein
MTMLWKKSWLDTRWRFLAGLGILACGAVAIVLTYPRAMALLQDVTGGGEPRPMGGEIGRRVSDALALARTYDGYLLSQWFNQTPIQIGTFFAILLGSGRLFSHGSSGSLFTLSLPVSRNRVLGTRAAIGLAEWFVLAMVPTLLLPLVSPSIGQHYGVVAALAHGVCLFIGGSVFFSAALLLSTCFEGTSRPLLFTITIAVVATLFDVGFRNGIYTVMSGDRYFYAGQLPWIGLVASAGGSAVLTWSASRILARKDF